MLTTLFPAHFELPIRHSCRLPFFVAEKELWIVEGSSHCFESGVESEKNILGVFDLSDWASHAQKGSFLVIEMIYTQASLIEVIVCVEDNPRMEMAKVLMHQPHKRRELVEVEKNIDIVGSKDMHVERADVLGEKEKSLSGDPKNNAKSVAKRKGHSVEESTRPDMEVPPELLDAGQDLDLPAANSRPPRPAIETGGAFVPKDRKTPPPREISRSNIPQHAVREMQSGASWSSQAVEASDSLELELDQEVEPLGEGDGATRVISMSDLGLLKGGKPKGRQIPMATIAQFDPLGSMMTEASIEAVSMEHLEAHDFEIDDVDILEEDFLSELDDDAAVVPNQERYEGMIDLDATIAPSSGVHPPVVENRFAEQAASFESDSESDYDRGEETSFISVSEMRAVAAAVISSGSSEPPPQKEENAPLPEPIVHNPKSHKERRKGSLEDLTNAMKQKRTKKQSERLGIQKEKRSPRRDSSPEMATVDESVVSAPTEQSSSERIRSIAEKARQRVEERELREKRKEEISSAELGTIEVALAKMEQARLLADEARQMMFDAEGLVIGLDGLLEKHSVLMLEDTDGSALEASTRREARKILELGRRIAEVEQNRLPSSTRKTLLRMVKELDKHLADAGGGQAARVALQLANRIFETIRRDLRPW